MILQSCVPFTCCFLDKRLEGAEYVGKITSIGDIQARRDERDDFPQSRLIHSECMEKVSVQEATYDTRRDIM